MPTFLHYYFKYRTDVSRCHRGHMAPKPKIFTPHSIGSEGGGMVWRKVSIQGNPLGGLQGVGEHSALASRGHLCRLGGLKGGRGHMVPKGIHPCISIPGLIATLSLQVGLCLQPLL